jgi:hypothetical protein
MEPSRDQEREVRAARNQSMFRAVNEQLALLYETMAAVTETFTIACECADTACLEMIKIVPDQYEGVRAKPRRFVVSRNHVHADVEVVVEETDAFVVVEKVATAADVAESLG